MTQIINTIPSRPDNSPYAAERLTKIEAETITLPAPTVAGLSFQINSRGQHIATVWEVEPSVMPDARAKLVIEAREAKAYFNDDMTLNPSRLQSSLNEAYHKSDLAEAAEKTAVENVHNEAGPVPELTNYAIYGGSNRPIPENTILTVFKSEEPLTARETNALIEAFNEKGFTMGHLGSVIAAHNGSELPEWLARAKPYYDHRAALEIEHNYDDVIANTEAANVAVWAIRYALMICPANTLRDLLAKVTALGDDALIDMEISDARTVLSIIRDLEAMQTETQSCAA